MNTPILDTEIDRPELLEWEQPFKSALSFLLQACMVAGRHGFGEESEQILEAVETMRPNHASPKLARALVYIYQNKAAEAIERLRGDLLLHDQKNELGQAFLAVALHQDGKIEDCRNVLQVLLRAGTNAKALAVAKSVASEIGLVA